LIDDDNVNGLDNQIGVGLNVDIDITQVGEAQTLIVNCFMNGRRESPGSDVETKNMKIASTCPWSMGRRLQRMRVSRETRAFTRHEHRTVMRKCRTTVIRQPALHRMANRLFEKKERLSMDEEQPAGGARDTREATAVGARRAQREGPTGGIRGWRVVIRRLQDLSESNLNEIIQFETILAGQIWADRLHGARGRRRLRHTGVGVPVTPRRDPGFDE
jgi:hypothetical protein